MTIAWITTKPELQAIEAFRKAPWEIRVVAPPDPMLSNLQGLMEVEAMVIEVTDPLLLDICQQLCGQKIAPVLALVKDLAYAQGALEGGADDFLLAPLNPMEALLRLRKLTRRANIIRVGELEIDVAAWRVRYRGHRVHMSPVEFRLLASLAKRVGQMVDHKTLLEEVWRSDPGHRSSAQLKSYVSRVRRKIEPDFRNPQYIVSIPGAGYRLRNQRQWEASQREAARPSVTLKAPS
jgi:DNA-binding response OmpR family regulator